MFGKMWVAGMTRSADYYVVLLATGQLAIASQTPRGPNRIFGMLGLRPHLPPLFPEHPTRTVLTKALVTSHPSACTRITKVISEGFTTSRSVFIHRLGIPRSCGGHNEVRYFAQLVQKS